MNHSQILKRAWKILWDYKILWIFGVIVALTAGGGGGNAGGGNPGGSNQGNWGNFNRDMGGALGRLNQFFTSPAFVQAEQTIIAVVIGLVCLAVIVAVLLTIARYVSQVALVRMVDHYEDSGEKVSFRNGWRMGWSRAAWRIFLINLVIFVPVMIVIVLMFGIAMLPVLLTGLANQHPSTAGIIATIGMVFVSIFVLIVIVVLLSLVMEIIYRVAILQDRGVFDSIRTGWGLVRRNLKDVGLMWLILIGIRLALGIVLIPVAFVLFGIALLAGGGVGAGLFFAIRAAGNNVLSWIIALATGVPIFIAILAAPLLFIEGLKQTYLSTTWTLAYRAIRPEPEVALPVVEEPAPAE
jgi:hypothetical protein